MIEFIKQFTDPAIVAMAIAVVALIKDKWIFKRLDTRLTSIIVTAVIILIVNFVALPIEAVEYIELLILVILPSFGYDYVVNPVIQSLLKLFRMITNKDDDEFEKSGNPIGGGGGSGGTVKPPKP